MYEAIKECLIEERPVEFLGTYRSAALKADYEINKFIKLLLTLRIK